MRRMLPFILGALCVILIAGLIACGIVIHRHRKGIEEYEAVLLGDLDSPALSQARAAAVRIIEFGSPSGDRLLEFARSRRGRPGAGAAVFAWCVRRQCEPPEDLALDYHLFHVAMGDVLRRHHPLPGRPDEQIEESLAWLEAHQVELRDALEDDRLALRLACATGAFRSDLGIRAAKLLLLKPHQGAPEGVPREGVCALLTAAAQTQDMAVLRDYLQNLRRLDMVDRFHVYSAVSMLGPKGTSMWMDGVNAIAELYRHALQEEGRILRMYEPVRECK